MSNVAWPVIAAALAGACVWVVQDWRADAKIAAIEARTARQISDATEIVARKNTEVLELERRQADRLAQIEEDAFALSENRARLALENDRLSRDLGAALERLRNVGSRPAAGGGMSAAAAAADGCADVRTARDRAIAALDLLEREGDQAVGDGQRGVDAATIAAQAARETIKERK